MGRIRMFFRYDDETREVTIYGRGTRRWARIIHRDRSSVEIHLVDDITIVGRIGGELSPHWAQRRACDFVAKGE